MNLAEYQEKYTQAIGTKNSLQSQLDATLKKQKRLEKDSQALDKAQAFIQTKAQETQNQLSYRVEDIVQLAIDTCFPDEYQFQLKFEPKRGKTEAELNLIKEGWTVDPLTSCGGGLGDMEAFGLRISSWSLEQNNNVIILDEPFRFLSEDLRPMAGEILRELSQRLGLQFIIITHDSNIMNVADRVIMVSIKKGVTRVKMMDTAAGLKGLD
jgi:DNA repair exonuclease SbcCD ATPase subunit